MRSDSSFESLIESFITRFQVRNFSERTITHYTWHLSCFQKWCYEHNIIRPEQVTDNTITHYTAYLLQYRKSNGTKLYEGTRLKRLWLVKQFFHWLYTTHLILVDPAKDLIVPKHRSGLPDNLLTESEVNAILDQPDFTTTIGLRDRSILETLYSTGIRSSELVHLSVKDVSLSSRTVFIRLGKGKKDRLVPIGERACSWLQRYLSDSRPSLVTLRTQPTLFVNVRGRPLNRKVLEERVRLYKKRAGVTKKGGCHLFRHAMAIGMLENGADIRYIQAILGHANLRTTAKYTQVAITNLKHVHKKTHPFEQ
jgi:integrase/recombinase XerD